MKVCDEKFCIYNIDKNCILKDISISADGICKEIITVNIPKDVLDNLKREAFKRFEAKNKH